MASDRPRFCYNPAVSPIQHHQLERAKATFVQGDSRNLNLLRCIAVLSVFVSHALQYLTRTEQWSLGHAGVLLFFVHTSLVLMYSLERQGEGKLWRRFMIRRVFRIFPLSVLAVSLYVTFHIPSIVGYHWTVLEHLSGRELIANLTLTQNLISAESVPAALWSLPFELQMYLFLPLVFLVMRRASPRDAASVLLVTVALSAVMMGLAPGPIAAFFQYVPCFIAGPFAYALRHKSKFLPYWTLPFALALFLAIYCTAPADFVAVQWPLSIALGWILASVREVPDGAFSRITAWVAKYSYGIYLFHMAALIFFLPRFGVFGVLPAGIAVALISRLAYWLLEQPCITLGNRVSLSLSPRISTAPERRHRVATTN